MRTPRQDASELRLRLSTSSTTSSTASSRRSGGPKIAESTSPIAGPCGGAVEFEAELRLVIANHCRDHVPESLIRRIAEAIDEESRQHDGGH